MKIDRNFWNEKKVIVTGHTGFKGSWLVVFLNKLGCRVIGISDHKHDGIYMKANVSSLIDEEFFMDLSNQETSELFSIFKRFKPDIVFHFAAQSLVISSYKNPYKTLKDNILSSLNIFEATKFSNPAGTIVVSTTDKVYKNSGDLNSEDYELGGKDFYSYSKVAVEELIEAYKHIQPDLKISVIRSGNVIGGGDSGKNRLIPDIVRSMENNTILTLRHPDSIRPWLSIFDSLYGYLLLAELTYKKEQAGTYNLNSKENNKLTTKEIVEVFKKNWYKNLETEISSKYIFSEVDVLKIDSEKAKNDLNWSPKYNIEDCVKLTAKWEREIINDSNYSQKQIEDYLSL